ncbi:protein kinase domain-containing protein [Ditylenchus destructor]|nr:protein kinase domain-containing protein [Ditylenchus destructor]
MIHQHIWLTLFTTGLQFLCNNFHEATSAGPSKNVPYKPPTDDELLKIDDANELVAELANKLKYELIQIKEEWEPGNELLEKSWDDFNMVPGQIGTGSGGITEVRVCHLKEHESVGKWLFNMVVPPLKEDLAIKRTDFSKLKRKLHTTIYVDNNPKAAINKINLLIDEIRVLKKLGRTNFAIEIKTFFWYYVYGLEWLCMVTSYIGGGTLHTYFTHLKTHKKWELGDGFIDEEDVAEVSAEILIILEKLHDDNLAYRDLKPDNILLDGEGHLWLTDFGYTRHIATTSDDFCGTLPYIAQEIALKKGHNKAVDMWSLGALIFEMLESLIPKNLPISDEAWSLIEGLMDTTVETRLTAKTARNAKLFEKYSIEWKAYENRKNTPPCYPVIENRVVKRYVYRDRGRPEVPGQ